MLAHSHQHTAALRKMRLPEKKLARIELSAEKMVKLVFCAESHGSPAGRKSQNTEIGSAWVESAAALDRQKSETHAVLAHCPIF